MCRRKHLDRAKKRMRVLLTQNFMRVGIVMWRNGTVRLACQILARLDWESFKAGAVIFSTGVHSSRLQTQVVGSNPVIKNCGEFSAGTWKHSSVSESSEIGQPMINEYQILLLCPHRHRRFWLSGHLRWSLSINFIAYWAYLRCEQYDTWYAW